MDSSGMQLKGLHTIHLALRDVQALIDRGPKQTLAKKQLIQKRQADHEAARDRLKQARLLADQKNLQLKTQEARIAEYRAKQNTAASNREYDIIKGQIAADEMSKSVLEDEIFEALEQIDKCQLEIAEREKEVAAAQAELVRYEAEYAAEKPGLEAKKRHLFSNWPARKVACRRILSRITDDRFRPMVPMPWHLWRIVPAAPAICS